MRGLLRTPGLFWRALHARNAKINYSIIHQFARMNSSSSTKTVTSKSSLWNDQVSKISSATPSNELLALWKDAIENDYTIDLKLLMLIIHGILTDPEFPAVAKGAICENISNNINFEFRPTDDILYRNFKKELLLEFRKVGAELGLSDAQVCSIWSMFLDEYILPSLVRVVPNSPDIDLSNLEKAQISSTLLSDPENTRKRMLTEFSTIIENLRNRPVVLIKDVFFACLNGKDDNELAPFVYGTHVNIELLFAVNKAINHREIFKVGARSRIMNILKSPSSLLDFVNELLQLKKQGVYSLTGPMTMLWLHANMRPGLNSFERQAILQLHESLFTPFKIKKHKWIKGFSIVEYANLVDLLVSTKNYGVASKLLLDYPLSGNLHRLDLRQTTICGTLASKEEDVLTEIFTPYLKKLVSGLIKGEKNTPLLELGWILENIESLRKPILAQLRAVHLWDEIIGLAARGKIPHSALYQGDTCREEIDFHAHSRDCISHELWVTIMGWLASSYHERKWEFLVDWLRGNPQNFELYEPICRQAILKALQKDKQSDLISFIMEDTSETSELTV